MIGEQRFAPSSVKQVITLPGHIGLKPGQYSGLIEDASDANHGNSLRVSRNGWLLQLNKLSSIAVDGDK